MKVTAFSNDHNVLLGSGITLGSSQDQQAPSMVATLTNQSGGDCAYGDVVIVDTTNDDAFKTTNSPFITAPFVGVLADDIASGDAGFVYVGGYVPYVNVNGSNTTRGYFLGTALAKTAQAASARQAGTFGQILTGGTAPAAIIWNPDLAGSGSLEVKEADGSPDVTGVTTIIVSNGTLTDNGGGSVTVTTGATGGSARPLDGYTLDATYGDDFTGASLNAKWARRNYVSGAETYQAGPLGSYLRIAHAGRAKGDGYLQTITGSLADGTYAMAFVPRFYGANPPAWGICVLDGSGNGVSTNFYGTPTAMLMLKVTTYTTYGNAYVQPGGVGSSPNISTFASSGIATERKVWVYVRKAGTSYYCAYSMDGDLWSPESSAYTWIAGAETYIGMYQSVLGLVTTGLGTGSYCDVDWFGKIA